MVAALQRALLILGTLGLWGGALLCSPADAACSDCCPSTGSAANDLMADVCPAPMQASCCVASISSAALVASDLRPSKKETLSSHAPSIALPLNAAIIGRHRAITRTSIAVPITLLASLTYLYFGRLLL